MSVPKRSRASVALAHYLGLSESELVPWLELKRDLKLEPLDVVWFLAAAAPSECLSFPFEQLTQVRLVGQLLRLVDDWLDANDHEQLLAADEELFGVGQRGGSRPPARRASGVFELTKPSGSLAAESLRQRRLER